MTTINKLTATDTVSAGDQLPIYVQTNGDARKVAVSVLLAYIQAGLVLPTTSFQQYVTQYAAPSLSGFSVAITPGTDNVHLILTPTTGFAAGTIVLPPYPGAIDKQEVLVNCTQQVTALTVSPNGAGAVTGEPTALGADDFFRLKFDLPTQTWYRVG